MYILGINAYHGDAAAALIKDGVPVACAEEERFRRVKHWAGFPKESIKFCLQEAGIHITDVSHVGVSRNPLANLNSKIFFIITGRPNFSKLLRDRLENVAKIKDVKGILAKSLGLKQERLKARFHYVEHHISHMASSFFVSNFSEAALLSIDGFGDFVSTMWGMGRRKEIKVLNKVTFPHSLGILYTAFTQYLGFRKYGDEFKVMGLAPYGKPVYMDKFRNIVSFNKDGTYKLNLDYFLHHKIGADMTWDEREPVIGKLYSEKLIKEFGHERISGTPIMPRHRDIAATLQTFLEESEYKILNCIHRQTKMKSLCLAGGVGFNSVANGKILSKTPFENIFIQPASGDAGTSLGAAYYVYNSVLHKERKYVMDTIYLGTEYNDSHIESALERHGLKFTRYEDKELLENTARFLSEGKIVGWFQGRMEFGPRALGNRSILADPRKKDMKDVLNARVKHREKFRPFAPSILEEDLAEYFEKSAPSPYMLMVYTIKKDKRHLIPVVTHTDGTGRVQTVNSRTNPRYWGLIKEFKKITGIPVLLNTSFNENEPIVSSPEEAINCFLRTKMDVLAIGHYIVKK